jgi:hypothetical protein
MHGRSQQPAEHTQFKQFRESPDKSSMKCILWISLLFYLSMSSGCMVIDELDSAAALMPSKGKSKNEAKQDESVVAATPGAERKNAILRRSKEWWKSATSLAPTGLESSIVSCRLREGTQFMSRNDCLSHGGKPGRVSG